MRLQPPHDLHELAVGVAVHPGEVLQGQGVPDAGDDVLTLRVDQVVAVRAGHAGGRVAGERDAGAGGLAEVAEHHRADVHRRAEVVRDPLPPPVQPGPLGVPGVEDRPHRQVQLKSRVLRELPAGALQHDALEVVDQLPQHLGRQLHVAADAVPVNRVLQGPVEERAVEAEHGLAEHLDQPAVGVPAEPGVAGGRDQALDGPVVEADVEHRLHHPRHRERGPGADADQQRVHLVAEPAADRVLQVPQRHRDLHPQRVRLPAAGQVVAARLGGDGEARRDRQAEVRHLGEVGPLPAQQVLLVLVTLAELVDELLHGPHRGHLRPVRELSDHCAPARGGTPGSTAWPGPQMPSIRSVTGGGRTGGGRGQMNFGSAHNRAGIGVRLPGVAARDVRPPPGEPDTCPPGVVM